MRKATEISWSDSRGGSRTAAASKVELFVTKPLISPPKQILSNEGTIPVLDSYHIRLLNAFYFR